MMTLTRWLDLRVTGTRTQTSACADVDLGCTGEQTDVAVCQGGVIGTSVADPFEIYKG